MNMGTPCFRVVERGNIEFTAFSKRECNEEEKKNRHHLVAERKKSQWYESHYRVSCFMFGKSVRDLRKLPFSAAGVQTGFIILVFAMRNTINRIIHRMSSLWIPRCLHWNLF